MNDKTPTVIPLYREDEDRAAGWAMVLPGTGKVIAYVSPGTGVGTGSVSMFSALGSAERILDYMGSYLVPDLSTRPSDLPAPR